MGRRRATALAAAGLVLALAGCSSDGDATGGGEGADGSGSAAERPTPIDAALLECGDPAGADPTLQLSEVDLTQVTWEIPSGFVETFAYSEDLPVEHIESFWAAEPEEDPVPLNVLTVVVYGRMDWSGDADECGRVPISAVDERLAGYHEVNGAQPLTEVEQVELAGLPALRQDLELPDYSYRGYWVFGRDQMVHLYCQWTSEAEQERVLAGCEELLASFEAPGA